MKRGNQCGIFGIISDNCASQYKCAAHFWDLQQIANTYNTTLIRFYGIAGHGKGEVDHVSGITKYKVRREVAAGSKLQYSEEMVAFLSNKFGNKVNPFYTVKNVEPEQLEISRAGDRLRKYITLKGSSSFQVMDFKPHMKFRVSPRLCSCDQCCTDYGSCELFSEYDLTVQELNKVCLRSDDWC